MRVVAVEPDGGEVHIFDVDSNGTPRSLFERVIVAHRGEILRLMGHRWDRIHVIEDGRVIRRFCRDCVYTEKENHPNCPYTTSVEGGHLPRMPLSTL